jgi:hypothetical protein
MMLSDVICSCAPLSTVSMASPVATVLSALLAIAVMVVVPWLAPWASPVEPLMEATAESLEYHATVPFRFTVVPAEVTPMARNWLV